MLQKLKNLVVEEEGQGLSEYGLILAGVVVVAVAVIITLKADITALFDGISGQINP
ncbi:Flp family type IVb pilin [Bacillus sp. S3]|uniref:Flp family type IVb pilin n=1 Tax=Bacillus sp. S3 TaxID=486398 RepID=UPI00118BE3DB|nr:Flp family type IVb pilin [Bacillus sp. S3]QCJ44028.1 Flp family type IVb pilin [Bacillus sp. S3]